MVLQLGEALPPLLKELDTIVANFASLARKHRRTPTLGRTLLQPATPMAIAGWASDIARAARRLEASFKETQVVQFGGASGSLSALGDKAEPVMVSLGQLDKELSGEMALLGHSPKFVDRLLAELRRK